MPVPELAPSTQDILAELLPPWTFQRNPGDTGRPGPELCHVFGAVAAATQDELDAATRNGRLPPPGMPVQTVLAFLPIGLAVFAGMCGWFSRPAEARLAAGCFPSRCSLSPERVAGMAVIVAMAGAGVVAYASAGLPRAFAPLTTNCTTSAQYTDIGREVGRLAAGRTVASAGEIGVPAYACDCTIIDGFSDRGRMPQAIADLEARTGDLSRGLLRVNFAFFGYTLAPRRAELALIRKNGPPPPNYLGRWSISAPRYETTQLYLVPAS